MQLIKSVEISYFRSLYRVKLDNLRALNVLSGRNDTGKSNILKALNLFFNNQTDWQRELEFYHDFSYKRLDEVRRESIKGKQFIRVAIEFYRPDTYRQSLPESFKVERTWYRDGNKHEKTNLESLSKKKRLPGTLNTANRMLYKLLNRIHFEYVPVVKDKLYFEHILQRLQRAVLRVSIDRQSNLGQVTDNLASHIQESIVSLQNDFQRATGLQSKISPPADLASLFRAFIFATDFGTDQSISIFSRGDGIQARYLTSVLYHIAESSRDIFIWGFEEPENSLEYSYVIDLANDLENRYSDKSQIIVTTHSPALTALKSDKVSCFRVNKNADGSSQVYNLITAKRSAEQRAELEKEMGFLRLQEEAHLQLVKEKEEKRVIQEQLD